jgi:hypothetical protein
MVQWKPMQQKDRPAVAAIFNVDLNTVNPKSMYSHDLPTLGQKICLTQRRKGNSLLAASSLRLRALA